MRAAPILFAAFARSPTAPAKLIENLGKTPDRTCLRQRELLEIAQTKLAGTTSAKRISKLILANEEAKVVEASTLAFAATKSRNAVAELQALSGVGVAVASAALSWCFPDRWPVIDRHAWNTLAQYDRLPAVPRVFRPEHYEMYASIVIGLATDLRRTPQEIDRWLYAFDKCHLVPGDAARL